MLHFRLIHHVVKISGLGFSGCLKDCTDLAHRVSLLTHLLEEIGDSKKTHKYHETSLNSCFSDLSLALQAAIRLLFAANNFEDSKISSLRWSAVSTNTRDQIRALMEKDPATQYLVDLIKHGKTRQFWLDGELVKTKGDRLYVPKGGDLRKSLITECHDTIWAGHPGEERTCALLQRAYYWPQMRDDIATYVKTCLICQQDKADHQKKAGLLEPLSVPSRPFESVSMDYIIGWLLLLLDSSRMGSLSKLFSRLFHSCFKKWDKIRSLQNFLSKGGADSSDRI
ncbi:uncharacterized protein LOC111390459 [Olea europaea var. sylvestris]|uniref:uncharacterized protein LOC111390459 n=1 Tax=Olea europaea var. sylvestris TaxID=158386 RepID=UPI000C1D1FC9|nr:uncharacterized protein LOC111390459 [Olea europaea var. sylvestris]